MIRPGRRGGSNCQNPRQDPAHHRYRASPNGKRAGFCRRRFRILAPDRSRQSRFSQAHCRGRYHQRRAGVRVRAHLLIPCHRAKGGPAASCRSHRPAGRGPIRESRQRNTNRPLSLAGRWPPISKWRRRRCETAKAAQTDADSRIANAQALAAGESEAFQAANIPPASSSLTSWRTRRKNGPSWLRECGMTGSLPTFARTPRSRPLCTKKRTGNRRSRPMTCRRTACISRVMF